MQELIPREIVSTLDKYVIGQKEAKKAVAIALRNRYRRKLLEGNLKEEIMPKNIIMIGPTGVGKTEIARRIAKFINAPFLKVEVTKYTEVGYVGRDVESMIRDLIELSISKERNIRTKEVREKARENAKEKILDLLLPGKSHKQDIGEKAKEIFESMAKGDTEIILDPVQETKEEPPVSDTREKFRKMLEEGKLDERMVEIEVKKAGHSPMIEIFSGSGLEEFNISGMMGGILGGDKKKKQKTKVKDAIELLTDEEANKLVDKDEIVKEAISKVESSGIIFLDEIDKVIGGARGQNGNVSREGVQRDLLPLVEGSTVMTKHGAVKTDHILFIAAGAFYSSKPSELIPELQGRFPIRVELNSLSQEDFKRILLEPENALTKQYAALIGTEGIKLVFDEASIEKMAEYAFRANEEMENIGARRLHTILERLLEEISFNAPEMEEKEIVIDSNYVEERMKDIIQDKDLSKYIL